MSANCLWLLQFKRVLSASDAIRELAMSHLVDLSSFPVGLPSSDRMTPMTEQFAPRGSDGEHAKQEQAPWSRRTLRGIVVAVVGGALTAGALGWVSSNTSTSAASSLSTVPVTDIGAAAQTIDPAMAGQFADEAKSCKVPLAQLTIAKVPGASGGTIRIRSGNYLSPPFQLTDVPQRIAIPFPASYPVGHGEISVEGNASGAMISLLPGWTVATVNGSAVHSVFWKTGDPCP
jgi:hypothetical protein